MPDLTWAPCEHENRVDDRYLADPPWPRRQVCTDCGKPVFEWQDGTITEEGQSL